MYSDKRKNVLFVAAMECKPEFLTKHVNHINPEDIIILRSYEGGVLQPFGDVMRDIIIAVYHKNIEEIFVIAAKNEQHPLEDILSKLADNHDFQEKLQTLDYLFKNNIPELSGASTREWLEGHKTAMDFVQKSVNTIRNHPLIPSDVRVHGLFMNRETEEMSEVGVF
ncbi:carbonic anhydrase [Bacillus timonensis]|uniref:hypothetical protein n=1 Tax=Bacillus timonensis TaxID=1033734 RepID=UPI000474CC3F|nr:hypothetical protein [Bacillus timonensis]